MKQFLSSAIAAVCIVCTACMPLANQTPAAAPSAAPSATATAEPTGEPVEIVQTVSGVVVSSENGGVAIMPLPGEALLASADLVAFPSAALPDLGVKKGDIVQVFYTGDAAESYPVQIHATNWSVADATSALYSLLSDLATSVFPGTAGSSLTAAKYLGMLLDYAAESGVSPAAAGAVAAAFHSSLDETASALFFEQLSLVLGEAESLLSDTGRDLLESAGYTPTAYPWDADSANAFLTALGTASVQ